MHTFYRRYGKRLLDIILGILGCIPACPVMLIVIIAMFFFDRGTIFFVQERAGKRDVNGNPTTFRMHKFRTMKMDTPHDVPNMPTSILHRWENSCGNPVWMNCRRFLTFCGEICLSLAHVQHCQIKPDCWNCGMKTVLTS